MRKKKGQSGKERKNLLPSPIMMERELSSVFGAQGGEDPRWKAQELMYDAWETRDLKIATKLATKALTLDPLCLDAMLLLAQVTAVSTEEEIEFVRKVVEIGKKILGEQFFRDSKGHFWGILETRPYMNARALLAQLLVETGKLDEAIVHYKALLRLNPNDNQGLRYPLLGLYLSTARLDDARKLFKQYKDEESAIFAWGTVLERYLLKSVAEAKAKLGEARQVNRHVEDYLTRKKKMPKTLPEFYGWGDVNEAIVCVDEIGGAWWKHPEAIEWLKQTQ